MKILRLAKDKLGLFASVAQQFGELHASVEQDGMYVFKRLTRWSDARLEYDRTILPPKKYFLPPCERTLWTTASTSFSTTRAIITSRWWARRWATLWCWPRAVFLSPWTRRRSTITSGASGTSGGRSRWTWRSARPRTLPKPVSPQPLRTCSSRAVALRTARGRGDGRIFVFARAVDPVWWASFPMTSRWQTPLVHIPARQGQRRESAFLPEHFEFCATPSVNPTRS